MAIWEGSVYPKGRKWWVRHKRLGSDDWTGAPTPFYRDVEGDKERAEALLVALREKWAAHRRAAGGTGPLTVRDWGEKWIAKRAGLDAVRCEEMRLRLHVYPVIGDVPLVDVRRSHVRAVVEAVREKPRAPRSEKEREAPERLAPRTVLHVYRTLRQVFRAAVRAELLAANPVDLERDELPKKEDKDPSWRADAVFTADEVERLISDPAIPEDRRVLYAIEFLTGSRSGEAAALRWERWDREPRPLGRMKITRSYNSRARVEKATKTKRPRLVPVHKTLAQMLAAWKLSGWPAFMGRRPEDGDLVVPSPTGRHRHVGWSLQKFHGDLATLGIRRRRHYDSRRTFASLAQDGGAAKERVRWLTHTPGDQLDDYTSPSWESLCEAVECIPVRLRVRGRVTRLTR